jgi:hypothetical protein
MKTHTVYQFESTKADVKAYDAFQAAFSLMGDVQAHVKEDRFWAFMPMFNQLSRLDSDAIKALRKWIKTAEKAIGAETLKKSQVTAVKKAIAALNAAIVRLGAVAA